ncbi:hypothetical protein FA15DRAFT_655615 [Coprinopsis marcescibilis]|uniref:Uncharacterized protein n=1 Tax=Coprinopsis marcescibilis TaxID=230819 RepID=A0A5C3KW01_COPMA|nr:hypothetical protein FA15DRAFT_655615 [Coprinopsis marcescibilis]
MANSKRQLESPFSEKPEVTGIAAASRHNKPITSDELVIATVTIKNRDLGDRGRPLIILTRYFQHWGIWRWVPKGNGPIVNSISHKADNNRFESAGDISLRANQPEGKVMLANFREIAEAKVNAAKVKLAKLVLLTKFGGCHHCHPVRDHNLTSIYAMYYDHTPGRTDLQLELRIPV